VELIKLGLERVSSVGCGCGTLEWLLQQSSGSVESIVECVNIVDVVRADSDRV